MNIEWHKITWYSKLLTLFVAFAVPAFAFYMGMRYAGAVYELKVRDAIQSGDRTEYMLHMQKLQCERLIKAR